MKSARAMGFRCRAMKSQRVSELLDFHQALGAAVLSLLMMTGNLVDFTQF
jgi:hypothetical protein